MTTTADEAPGLVADPWRPSSALLDEFPAVYDGDWLYLLMPRSMHAIRVPAARQAAAPWRRLLESYPSITAERLYRKPGAPWGTTIVVSHRCNLACVYCFSEVGHSSATLESDRMLAIVDHTLARRPAGPRTSFAVNFFGGEPTLAMNDIRRVVAHTERACAEAGVEPSFRMVTNGTAPREVLEYLAEHRFMLTVSMDASPHRQRGQRLYGKHASVDQTVETIKLLVGLGTSPRVRSTVTGETVEHMDETVRYFASLGVTFVHFEPVGPVGTTTPGRLSRYSSPPAEQYAENLLRALDAARPLGVGVFGYAYQHLLSSPARSYCAPMTGDDSYQVLNANGELIMCQEMQDPTRNSEFGHTIGKVAGRSAVFVDLLRKEAIGRRAAPTQAASCQTCYARDICKSGCPSRNIQATGDLTKLDRYSCTVAKRVCDDVLRRLAVETFRAVEPGPEPVIKPISLPPELCSPPVVGAALGILSRAKVVFALTGERLDPAVDDEIRRLRQLAGVSR